ncbi:MAG: hypothetical protein AAF388_10420 [Bacteroidota bacterium]
MKKALRWTLILISFLLFMVGGILLVIFHPAWAYKHTTSYQQFTILHEQELDEPIFSIIDSSLSVLEKSEIYDPAVEVIWCLNDGSPYPGWIERLMGKDTFRAFSHFIVMQGSFEGSVYSFQKFGQTLSIRQFLTHALVHNMQYAHHGFWDANPLGGHPHWKWEGYAEYISQENLPDPRKLNALVQKHQDPYTWIDMGKDQKTIYLHIPFLAATTYCFENQGMDYEVFMADTTSLESILTKLSTENP